MKNEESLEIVKEEADNTIDENIFNHIGRIRWGGRKREYIKMDFHILKFDKEESEFNWRSSSRTWLWDFLQRVRDSDLHKYYKIK